MKNLYLFLLVLAGTTASAQLYFPPTDTDEWETMTLEEAGFCADNEQAFYAYLERTNTDAFLLLKDGKIVLEKYFGSFTRNTPHLWNSAGKSLTAFAVGIAADLDSLDLNDPTADYLGTGWTNCPATEGNIRIIHQLTMTSGLSDETGDAFCTSPECLVCLADPGTRWAYHNGPYTLLGAVIEAATGQDYNDFIAQYIHQPTGMTGRYLNLADNRIFASNARSMARFGLLMLNEGSWGGIPVLRDTTYFQSMINSSQDLNPSYGYLWWLNGKASYKIPSRQFNFPGPIMPDAPAETYAAIGKDAQLLNVVPSQGLVLVRMGSTPEDNSLVSTMYNDSIWAKLNTLLCTTSTDDAFPINGVSVSPNPAGPLVQLTAASELKRVGIFGANGRWLGTRRLNGLTAEVNLTDFPRGVLLLRVETAGGVIWRRVVRQ